MISKLFDLINVVASYFCLCKKSKFADSFIEWNTFCI